MQMVMKVRLISERSGIPKEILLRPQVVWARGKVSAIWRIVSKVIKAFLSPVLMAVTSGSTNSWFSVRPPFFARPTSRRTISIRPWQVSGIPTVPSSAGRIKLVLYSRASGNTSSMRCCSPLTELMTGVLSTSARLALRALGLVLSRQRGGYRLPPESFPPTRQDRQVRVRATFRHFHPDSDCRHPPDSWPIA
jgi:hypothetical protein